MASFGVLLPTFDPLRTGAGFPVAAAARLIEQLGFDSVWAGDHLACPAPGLDSIASLAAAAAVTERVGLGFSVLLLGLRQPAWAAKQLATLQHLSGERLHLGVGVGGEFPAEFAAAGALTNTRGRRLDEALSVLPALMSGQPVDFEGRALELHAPGLEPPAAMPPILVGGRSEAGMRRAARFGEAWMPMWLSPEQLARRAGRLAELAAERGRAAPRLALLLGVRVQDDSSLGRRHAAAHVHGQYRLEFERVERWTPVGGAGRIAEALAAYLAVGVEEFVLMPLGPDPLTQIERLAAVRAQLPEPQGAHA